MPFIPLFVEFVLDKTTRLLRVACVESTLEALQKPNIFLITCIKNCSQLAIHFIVDISARFRITILDRLTFLSLAFIFYFDLLGYCR